LEYKSGIYKIASLKTDSRDAPIETEQAKIIKVAV